MRHISKKCVLFASAASVLWAANAHAQDAAPPSTPPSSSSDATTSAGDAPTPGASGSSMMQEIVVTASANPRTRISTSISVSELSLDQISQSAPTNAADILRNIPGIRAEASGGEGNANISVRGLPVASGGGKFVQFQEDGMPVLQFGDIDFGTPDEFLRADFNVERLEVVRGGSASTFASDAPGGVFNFISKTGKEAGGNIGVTEGLDFNQSRVDFDYGSPLGDGWRFHVGGYYRIGDGPRTVDYQAEDGGQIKANLTRQWDNGDFVRLDFKYLDDNSPVYLPTPVMITGSPSNPHVSSVPGFSATLGALQSPNFLSDTAIGADGQRIHTDLHNGYDVQSIAVGGEAKFGLGAGWQLDEHVRLSKNSGSFTGPYAQEANTASGLAQEIGGPGSTLQYATGPNAGQAANAATVGGNGLATRVALFNVTLNSLDNFTNVIQLSKSADFGGMGVIHFNAGNYTDLQDIVEDWHWNTYLETAQGKNASLLNVISATGQNLSQGGLFAYGEPYFGNCCIRQYNTHYLTEAPYASLGWEFGKLNLDASIRYDLIHASGSYAGSNGTTAYDVNGDGVIEVPEQTVPIVNASTRLPVDYTKNYISYSVGANYEIDPSLALFARGSRGGRANAERLLFGGGVNPDGSISSNAAINMVTQVEGGVKWRLHNFSVFATGFYASTEEQNQDVTSLTQPFISRVYHAEGVEIETAYHLGGFNLTGGATYTHSRIVSDAITPTDVGNIPQRQADWIYQVTPSYTFKAATIGFNIIGTTSSYADTTNTLVMPGYHEVNAFLQYSISKDLLFSVNANNIFNVIGLTEIDGLTNGVAATGLNTARSIIGRNITASLRYHF